MIRVPDGKLNELLANIQSMSRDECLAKWQDIFGRSPPKHLSLSFLRNVLMWEQQNLPLGRLPVKTERRLRQLASGKVMSAPANAGSHLVREWNGRTYQVEVKQDGFVMDGKTWRSLSAIAKHITGAHWSGPRFFSVE